MRPRLSVELAQEQRAVLTTRQLLEEYGSTSRVGLVNSIVESVSSFVEPFLDEKKLLRAGSDRNHLISRLAQQVVYAGGNELMQDVLSIMAATHRELTDKKEEMEACILDSVTRTFGTERREVGTNEVYESAKAASVEALGVAGPMSSLDVNEAIKNGPHSYSRSVFENWQNTLHSYSPVQESTAHETYERKRAEGIEDDQVPQMIKVLGKTYPYRTQHSFDVARTAVIRDATPGDVPAIAALYESSLIKQEQLSLLVPRKGDTKSSIAERCAMFRDRISGGVFVRPNSEEKILQEMSCENVEKTGLRLRIDILEKSNEPGNILAFGSYYDAAASETKALRKKRHATVKRYLTHGETRSPLLYEDYMKESLLANIDDVVLCGDVRATRPYVADRLCAWLFERMVHKYSSQLQDPERDKLLVAYRLQQLHYRTDPDMSLNLNKAGFVLENDSSLKLMKSWKWPSIARDFNARWMGDHVRSIDVDDYEFTLNPEWDVRKGSLRETHEITMAKWQKEQRKHGDITVDRPKKLPTA